MYSRDEDYNNMDYSSIEYYKDKDYRHASCFEFSSVNKAGVVPTVIFSLSVLANVLLIYIVVRFLDTRKVSNLFFLCLASFNLLFTLTLPFSAIYFLRHFNWMFEEAACKIIKGAFFTGQTGNLLLLMAMTLDRFCTVVLKGRPLTQPGRRLQCARVVCVATWVISIAAGIRIVVISEFDYYCSYKPGKREGRLGHYMQFVFLFLIPLFVIVFCYGCTLRSVLSVPHMRGRKRALALLFCHIDAFVVCFIPYNVLETYGRQLNLKCEYIFVAYFFSYILAHSYCVVNLVFFLLRPSVRTAVSTCLSLSSNSNDNTAHSNVHIHISV